MDSKNKIDGAIEKFKLILKSFIHWQLDYIGETHKVFILKNTPVGLLGKNESYRIDFDDSASVFENFNGRYFLEVRLKEGRLTGKFKRSWKSILDFFSYAREDLFSLSTLFYYSGTLYKREFGFELSGRYRLIFSWRLINLIGLNLGLVLTVFPMLHLVCSYIGICDTLAVSRYFAISLGGVVLLIADFCINRMLEKYSTKFREAMFKNIELNLPREIGCVQNKVSKGHTPLR